MLPNNKHVYVNVIRIIKTNIKIKDKIIFKPINNSKCLDSEEDFDQVTDITNVIIDK